MEPEIKTEQTAEAPKKSGSSRDLIATITRLTQENEALRSESKKHRLGKRDAGEEAAQLRAELDKATKERDTIRKQLESTPDELRQELDTLRGELRSTKHKDAFKGAAKAAGVREEALDDTFALSGYKAEGDDVDPDLLREVITSTLASRPYLKGDSKPDKKLSPGPGVSRGSTSKSGFAPTVEQLQDPVWLYHNQGKLSEAISSGNFVNPHD